MNIVKGVADLIRRTSSSQTGQSTLGSSTERFSPPVLKIRFSEVGDEGVLHMLWEKYENAVEVEKNKLFRVFLEQFIALYKKWEPVDAGWFPEAASVTVPHLEFSLRSDDIIVGCSAGHPAEVIQILIEEMMQLTASVTTINTSGMHSRPNLSRTSTTFNINPGGLLVLDALAIVTRSVQNCRVFGYYGGTQKLTALLKGAVVQLKAIAGALSGEENADMVEKTRLLQQILVYVVLILCTFIDIDTIVYEKTQLYSSFLDFSFSWWDASLIEYFSSSKVPAEARHYWHQKAVVSVMEAGGLNWLVELLRVVRRLSMKEQWTDMSLQYLTLRSLMLALSDNARGQNHFKSIGGLEVLLDGLGFPSVSVLLLKNASDDNKQRKESLLLKIYQLHVLSSTVIREAVLGNLSNLQFLCENGRIQKFANSFCSLAFVLQEYKQQKASSTPKPSSTIPDSALFSQLWSEYAGKLSRVLCSFIVAPESVKSHVTQLNTGRVAMPVSPAYSELSIKWVMRALLTVFPCIKACSNQNELTGYLRDFVGALQHSVLNCFQKLLASSPVSLEILREEGVWDLIFSEYFFYFGSELEELPRESGNGVEVFAGKLESSDLRSNSQTKDTGIEVLQMEAISFLELAATANGSVHNLPELSVLLDAVEQCACHLKMTNILANCLRRILQISYEKTISSFKTIGAIPRILKVACILGEESRKSGLTGLSLEGMVLSSHGDQRSNFQETTLSWHGCMEIFMELFTEFFSSADDAKSLVLCDQTSIDCLFDLFWEDHIRNYIFQHILDLMKLKPSSMDDRKAKLQLCSKYLETFNQVKEREKNSAELSISLLAGIRQLLMTNREYYQGLFRDGECFLHVVSLLNGNLDERDGKKLILSVLQTLTLLLAGNDESKASFRALVGKGYQTLQSLLLDFCQRCPSEELLNALLDMLVDGNFNLGASPLIKNEDVILLYLSILQKSGDTLRHSGLNTFQQLLRDSISNRASCISAGMLNFLLDWFSLEEKDNVILKIAQLIQVIGGHSISGKDIRKIFAILRGEKVGSRQQYCSLLLTSVSSMLNEKGPTAFFDLNGDYSGIKIRTPMQWPLSKGFSFSCWLRVESFPGNGMMGLFSFLTDNGRGCYAGIDKDGLIFESINLKRQWVKLNHKLARKKWQFLCVTHSIGRAFSGGSMLRCYVDGDLVSSERCRYAKLNELLTCCGIGMKIHLPCFEEDSSMEPSQDTIAFHGQIGPVYLFSDAISSEQVRGIYSLGPSYMYSFVDCEATPFYDNPLLGGVFDARDGLASKVIVGINAQASDGKRLFNISAMLDHASDNKSFEANIMVGTQLCSRRLLQDIIYCVGGVSVFFPLISQSDRYEKEESGSSEHTLLTPITKERLAAEVIELIASVLDENLANQQQMHMLSGFSILGFLLQSIRPEQLNLETLSALKHLYNVVANGGLAELLVQDAVSGIFLNPFIWICSEYNVQRELYMFLLQQFDNDPRLLKNLCRFPRVIDIIRQFYWDNAKSQSTIACKPLLHTFTRQVIGERTNRDEVHKIRLLLLSLGEMSLRQGISATDIKALISFFEISQDLACVEDVLHMVIRAVSQKQLLVPFLEQVNAIGGCHIFLNLLEREYEPIRLLGLQFLGRLLVGLPSEKKELRFFSVPIGRSRSLSENQKKINSKTHLIFLAISNRLFRYSQTDNLRATLFDVLLGGASPKQILQKNSQSDKQRSKGNYSHFLLPQILVLIFRFLARCKDVDTRIKIIRDLLDLLDSNSLNIEAFMEYGWNAWLRASLELSVLKNYKHEKGNQGGDNEILERDLARSLFSVVLCHYTLSVKGGWHQLEETVNFLLMQSNQGAISNGYLLRDIYEDLVQNLVDIASEENIFGVQPCRDNTLYLLHLIDEILVSEMDPELPFPKTGPEIYAESSELASQKDNDTAMYEGLEGELDREILSNLWDYKHPISLEGDMLNDKWWNLYDNVWIVICEMNGKGPRKVLPKSSSMAGPSLGQRARGLVESLNIPATEMAVAVMSGGISTALGGKSNKPVDKAMALRWERCPRIVFRLAVLYLCRASLEMASRCVQQVISLLPSLLANDEELNKSRLQLFIRALLTIRSKYGVLDDGARFHVISQLIRETVNCGKTILASTIVDKEDSCSNSKNTGSIQNLIQKDQVLAATSEETKYIKMLIADRSKQLHELHTRMDEISSLENTDKKEFDDELCNIINAALVSDDNRRVAQQLAYEEEQQYIAEKWIHVCRTLIDERGPWSANPFPNSAVTHWKLDKTEDAWRRRPKLRQNYHFDEKLCHSSSTASGGEDALHANESKSSFVGHIPEQMKQFLMKGVRRITDEAYSESVESDAEPSEQKASITGDLLEALSSEPIKDPSDQKDIPIDKKETKVSYQMEPSEVLMSVPCVLITPKRKLAGKVAVMRNVLHFFGEFLVEGTGGSSVFNNLHSENSDAPKLQQKVNSLKWPVHVENAETTKEYVNQRQSKHVKRYRRWNVGKINSVHWTRYLLRYTAIEIFFCDSVAPVFLNFASQKEAKEVGTLIVTSRNDYLFPKGSGKEKSGTISFIDRRVALDMAEIARERWRRRDITNFEYLMVLNTLSGRTYNDLTQYPVFPWILADYSSEVLDFNKSSTFRDLMKPVGALDSKRFEVFEDRYQNFYDPDIPSFYYGSHYSSMGIVLYYLLRLEPFASLHRNLQGGKFDHADRLFQSIEGTYRNCLSNTSDVKELIPEFFYLPEFLVNSNSYHLGVKQDGAPIGDVCLPPWAKGSPELFISKNREALESEYVSSNLHHWIDLVFGYKQRGKPAVEAANVFYYLTYEGAVDLDTMEDELQRAAIEDQIANFGQTPMQIFRKKHPRRGPPIPIAHPLYFAPDSIDLTSVVSSTSYPPSAVLYVGVLESNIILVNQGLTLSVKIWLTTQLQSGGNFTFSSFQEPLFGVGSDILSARKIGSPMAENVEVGSQCFATMQTQTENFLISCGNWENSFQIISLNDGRTVQSVRQHKDIVSCVAVSADGTILATGSYDTTVMVWEVIRVRNHEKRVRNIQTESSRKDHVIIDTPFHILCGHDDVITCLYASVELDIVVSGSKDGSCIFHTLREGKYVRSVRHPAGCAVSKLVVSRHGKLVLYADDDLSLNLYSINGKHLSTAESNGRISCVEPSTCGEFLVCAVDQGQIVVRSMSTLEVVKKYSGPGKMITCLTVTQQECFLAGTKDGSLLVYSIENPQLCKSSVPRSMKSKASITG